MDISNNTLQEVLNSILVQDTATGRFGFRTVAKATSLSNTPVDLSVEPISVLRGLIGNDADNEKALNYKRITSAANTKVENQNLSIEEIIRKCLAYDENGQLVIVLIENL